MAVRPRPRNWLSEKAGIVARCNPAIGNHGGKRREEMVLSRVTAGKPRNGKDSEPYSGEERTMRRHSPCLLQNAIVVTFRNKTGILPQRALQKNALDHLGN